MNILITSAGQRVSLVRAFQKELENIVPAGKVYTVDMNPILAPACHVSAGYKSVPRVTDISYLEKLMQVCKDWDIKMIIPTIDTELQILADNRAFFLDEGITPIVSSSKFINACRDKRIVNEFFVDRAIDIPKAMSKDKYTFPFFIKPYDGSLSKDIFLVNSKEDLTEYHFSNPKLMFMEYINPKEFDEYTVDCYYNKLNNLSCVVPRKRIFVRAGEINKGVTHKNEIVSYVKEHLNNIPGAIGCLTMQFFFHQVTKRIIGIEINPRFGGGFPLSYLAGANYPAWLIKEYMYNVSIEYFDDWEDNLLMLRYDDEILVGAYEG